VPPLGSGARPIKDVRVDAPSIAARLSSAAASGTTTASAAGGGAAVAGSSPTAND